MKTLLPLILALLAACSSGPSALTADSTPPAGPFDHDHAILDGLLSRHVKVDGVDYRGLATEREELDRYLAGLQSVAPAELESWTRDQQMAFWINAYNAHVLRLIVDHADDPPESIRDLGGSLVDRIWDKPLVPVAAGGDGAMSLDDIEHGILRPGFEDARIHAAINCASGSCPPLLAGAYRAETLDSQLDEAMRAFVNDPSLNKIDPETGELELSAIFDWFEEDFTRDGGTVQSYVQEYVVSDEKDWILEAEVDHKDYDWSLNEASDE